MQKGQTHTVGYTVGMQYAVGVSAKMSTHSLFTKYGWSGPLPLVQKGQTHTVGYTVQHVVGVSAKRSIHTVDLANMGGGDHYL